MILAYLDFYNDHKEILSNYEVIFNCRPFKGDYFCANGTKHNPEIRGLNFIITEIEHIFDGEQHYLEVELKLS